MYSNFFWLPRFSSSSLRMPPMNSSRRCPSHRAVSASGFFLSIGQETNAGLAPARTPQPADFLHESFVQVLDVSNHDVEQPGMVLDGSRELLDSLGQGSVGGQHFAQRDEGTDNENVQLRSALVVGNRRL